MGQKGKKQVILYFRLYGIDICNQRVKKDWGELPVRWGGILSCKRVRE